MTAPQRTPLFDAHTEHNGKLVDFGGWGVAHQLWLTN